jgi:putative alpha-1,2-mannosidase
MFPFAGAKYQNYTVKWTKWIVDNAYGTQSNGLPGNDDFGTLSAWMSWSMLGFYPLAGSSRFVVGAPRFDKICIQREVGELCVIGHNVNKIGFTHVNKCVLNGNVLLEPFFDFKDIGTGISTLEFNMSDVEGIWG